MSSSYSSYIASSLFHILILRIFLCASVSGLRHELEFKLSHGVAHMTIQVQNTVIGTLTTNYDSAYKLKTHIREYIASQFI